MPVEMDLRPIGFVRNDITEPKDRDWGSITSEIVLDQNFEEALSELAEFSHISVVYWMHKTTPAQRLTKKVHPKANKDLPLVGVFATCSPARPNPIGVTTVKLLEHRGNVLKVIGLDAIDGTPVLDIKPYMPLPASYANAKTPGWITRHDSG
jgi:tRNA-Thr(GGU) m(6)t(6)A37 methyltransferase TsaA